MEEQVMWIVETRFLPTSEWKHPSMGCARISAPTREELEEKITDDIHRLYDGVRLRNTKTGEIATME